jgi:hypothetical protein
LVYCVEVATDADPKAGDDAKSAKFYNLKDMLLEKDNFAFDHYDILNELIEKKLKGLY